MSPGSPDGPATVVTADPGEKLLVWTFPVLGALAGWGIRLIAGWVAGLAWAPLQGPFTLVASIDEPWATVGACAVGGVVGLLLTMTAIGERLTVRVASDEVTLTRDDKSVRVPRSAVDSVFLDGKQVVLLAPGGAELAREPADLSAEGLAAAFQAHGYPWRADGDPYAGEFRLWVPNVPGLPAGADALFAARAQAIEKKKRDDLAAIRAELLRLGVVVRDDGRRQYWRVVGRSASQK